MACICTLCVYVLMIIMFFTCSLLHNIPMFFGMDSICSFYMSSFFFLSIAFLSLFHKQKNMHTYAGLVCAFLNFIFKMFCSKVHL